MSYRVDVGYLERIDFADGDLGYCRPCDATVPLHITDDKALRCDAGHRQHAANFVTGSFRKGARR